MREDGGFEEIKRAVVNLSLRHKEHISAYGEGNERRLTGKHETASINTFSWVCPMTFMFYLSVHLFFSPNSLSIHPFISVYVKAFLHSLSIKPSTRPFVTHLISLYRWMDASIFLPPSLYPYVYAISLSPSFYLLICRSLRNIYCSIGAQGVANRGCSVRVGRETEKQGKGAFSLSNLWHVHASSNDDLNPMFLGYMEDRRPASNMDPYVVTALLAETTILWEPSKELVNA